MALRQLPGSQEKVARVRKILMGSAVLSLDQSVKPFMSIKA